MFREKTLLLSALVFVVAGVLVAVVATKCRRQDEYPMPPVPDRQMPDEFPANTHLPNKPEGTISGSIDLNSFSPGRDLMRFDDDRIWWESDNDRNDTEDDHSMHVAIEGALRKLVELVDARGGTLEVHEGYRADGIHNPRSLHKEGRAIDVTCDQMPLGELAKLCWISGFDWVYYEARKGKGAHVHCSVQRPVNNER